jgi:hypothetical protein
MHVLFVFMYIHKASQCLSQSYSKQELEKNKKDLAHKKQTLMHEIHVAQNRSSIHDFAAQKLNMTPIVITQIKKIPHSSAMSS